MHRAGCGPDLRLVAMSATLDGERFAALMGHAPVIASDGRSHPLTLRHLGRAAESRIEDAVASAVRVALADEEGGVLAFLPGVAEIERTAERLTDLPGDVVLHRLHGTLPPEAQRAAIRAEPDRRRKLVLATSIAETSLTLDGIRVVVDSGLARRPRYDRAAGMTRLATERASQAAVTQRAGRAARQAPGVAYRLWEEAATAGLPRFDTPEILEADLSALVLATAIWGVADPRALAWLDPPPVAAVAEARARLATIGALDGDGRPTPHGRAVAALPLAPRLAHMLVRAAAQGLGETAAKVAVLLGERGLGGNDVDLETRLRRWRGDRGGRAEAARKLAQRWANRMTDTASNGAATIQMPLAARDVEMRARPADQRASTSLDTNGVGIVVAFAYPDRVARRREPSGESWASVGGSGFRLDPASPLARAEWLAVAETAGMAAGARILSAAALDAGDVEALFGDRIETRRTASFDPTTGAVQSLRERRLGAIRLASGPDPDAGPAAIAAALLEGVRAHGLNLLPWSDTAGALRNRAAFAAAHGADAALDDAALLGALDDWLPSLLAGRRRLDAIPPGELTDALRGLVGWSMLQAIDRLAPTHLETPAGSRASIDYAADAGPTVELRPQALFGLARHPHVADGRMPLVLSLVSPAGRPIQTTRDLPGFWRGSWAAVAKEMRGRYPRHPWPDDPAAATPTLRTKNADAQGPARR